MTAQQVIAEIENVVKWLDEGRDRAEAAKELRLIADKLKRATQQRCTSGKQAHLCGLHICQLRKMCRFDLPAGMR